MSDETRLVPPVLVRDYRRLLRLFPYTYRRAHEAEMLGHLLDGAEPGQSRPSGAERWDLLRAAAREWLLAPLGSTPRQRRAGAHWLVVLLPLVLMFPAARVLGSLTWTLSLGDVGIRTWVGWNPLGPAWVVWVVGMVLLAAGAMRWAKLVLMCGAVAGWLATITLSALSTVGGGGYPVVPGVGWMVGQSVLVAAVAQRASVSSLGGAAARSRAWGTVAALGVALPVLTMAQGLLGIQPWFTGTGMIVLSHVATGGLLATVGMLGCVVLAMREARQALPALVGVAVALGLGRIGHVVASLEQLDVVDPGNVAAALTAALVVTGALRWLVNRLDELAAARRALAEGLSSAVGGPTTA